MVGPEELAFEDMEDCTGREAVFTVVDFVLGAIYVGRLQRGTPMPHHIDVMVGKRVRLRRLQLALSQTDLAEKVGVTFQQLQKYEKGTNRISCSRLSEISEVLDVPIAYFFADKVDTKAEVAVAEELEPRQLKDGMRLITAYGQIADANARRRLLALVESMVAAGKS